MFRQGIATFHKVTFEQYVEDMLTQNRPYDEEDIINMYDRITLPFRATKGSAGYDFVLPEDVTLKPGEYIVIPTGIRCQMEEGWVLMMYPRSGQGFKYGLRLANTTGIIDADYFQAKNEGHIQIKLINDSSIGKTVELKAGDCFCQGVFLPFGMTTDDTAANHREGGFGSTSQ